MSTDAGSRRARTRRRRSRAFLGAFAIVIGVLAVVGLAGAAVSTAQGPRVTKVSIDPDAAVNSAGSRMIVTTTQSLAEVDPTQVTVTPAADITVDTSGRSVGVRFALPLWDDTEYTVTIDGVTGVGGGASTTITETFHTPALQTYLLLRGSDGDTVFQTDLTGEQGVPVFTDPQIEDFRATASHLVISTLDDNGESHLIVTDLDGANARELPLPGPGTVSNLQSADRGNLIGYTFTDADIGASGTRESMLYTASLAAAQAEDAPTPITRTGGESRVDDWRFVPGTDSILMLTFDGALTLVSPSGGAPVALGNAVMIDGIARGSTTVVIERVDGPVAIDLSTAQEQALPITDPDLGQTGSVLPLADGTTLRSLALLDGFTVTSTTVNVVDDVGQSRPVFSIDPADTLLETCVSPSGRYAAFLVAPDAVNNAYDGHQLPLPERVQTHIVSLTDGTEVVALTGFDISWCQNPPRL
ncbi:MAG: hypothetical protein ABS62_10500 [Microbacterium sp. SCN 70-200]|uniref:hypothetical protein n=1 Tax=unclassified Microbacterium TaxID=2609290 RepID=UPI00086F5CDD|nr:MULTISPECIES: hypothetical protein [unclassified Microbacterium]MBN9216076.1 hypothetical protein [Microbacterium sp.]ODT40298.1 MAG: hypothetical protein ABS62_10500 [Microbacterium sp. SCN 70-200]OJV82069.1 MAG: hypothetical protein BGO46_06055 [Microbacterium sp. 70-16]